ncbi:hypothetical protein L6452_09883 [Arctium lappa]|uniref:Uncharacterized protein n=1 Tax=Arctium lappa TaxID=4217 RepID=A0ACB9DLU4_ARCLA|nr:hypothetical protein L6452_09883 [Arctium lappa]
MRSASLLSLVFFILILSHGDLDAKVEHMGSTNSLHLIEGKKMIKGEEGTENGSGFENEDYIYTQSVP